MPNPSYVLVTPARNEETYLGETIESVLGQSTLPAKWVIVSDGSTDRTEEIAKSYADQHSFIEVVTAEASGARNFGSKVKAFQAGYAKLQGMDYDFIGNLDADVTLPQDYYERVLEEFAKDNRLGLAGGIIVEAEHGVPKPQVNASWSVAGAVQLFRRECYEDFGGYVPLTVGGIDTIAEVKARMKGWEVRCFPQIQVLHHKHTGTKQGGLVRARFRHGVMGYCHGNHPLFEIAKAIYRLKEKPFVIGSLMRLAGFGWSAIVRKPKAVPPEVVQFIRREQMGRLLPGGEKANVGKVREI